MGRSPLAPGGTSGIGARTAEVFVEAGARVVIAGRSQDDAVRRDELHRLCDGGLVTIDPIFIDWQSTKSIQYGITQ